MFASRLFLATSFFVHADANGQMFLGIRDQHLKSQSSHSVSDLLAELEQAAGRDQRVATERRIGRVQVALQPMFAAMPKDNVGRVGSASVRYLLHRLFVQRHGWFVNGLENGGDTWNSSSPARVFKEHADGVHDIFEERLNGTGKGFTLHQVAVFAATLEALVLTDSVERLQAAYRLLGFSYTDSLSDEQAGRLIDAYMKIYVLSMGNDVADSVFEEASEAILAIYPTWPDTETFVQEVRSSVLSDLEGSERTTWNSTLKVLEEVGERYGRWQDKECNALKATLLEMEEPGTGRVPLEVFYKSAFTNTSWQFMESVPYLRQLGALDETDPERKSVIITNYVYSPSNCVASSKFYSVCCIDECEELLGSLEKNIAAPEATPARILAEVSALASKTVNAPRELPASLKTRLEEIAAHHGGRVPLHARLFAQWMHHAYPRECPYPHLSGTTKPLVATAFLLETGEDVEISHDEMRDIIENSKTRQKISAGEEPELPWSEEEEFFVYQERPAFALTQLNGAHQALAWLAAACSMAVAVWRVYQQGVGLSDKKPSKIHV